MTLPRQIQSHLNLQGPIARWQKAKRWLTPVIVPILLVAAWDLCVRLTGTRLILTLTLELRRRHARRGLATACIGGGQGIAAIVETL